MCKIVYLHVIKIPNIMKKVSIIFVIMCAICTLSAQSNSVKNEHSCGTVTDLDGNKYGTVLIGDQCWMKENMRSTRLNDGSIISLGYNLSNAPYRYNPDNNSANVQKYGYLYNLDAAKEICPTGWRLPTLEECVVLLNYCSEHYAVGGEFENNAKALASTSGWKSSIEVNSVGCRQDDNDQSGFSAFPAGIYNGTYKDFGRCAFFWSSTPYFRTQRVEEDIYDQELFHGVFINTYYKDAFVVCHWIREYGRSVRCIRE